MPSDSSRADLLGVARDVLASNGFNVKSEPLEGTTSDWVLAESDLFIVAVAAAGDLQGLREVESFAAPELIERISTQGSGGKRWDAYLVLVTNRAATQPDDARALVDMEYDTRGVRRLVEVAVEPTMDDLRRVLRPFMPLPPAAEEGATDAFADLTEQLVLNGVVEGDASRIVAAWQTKGNLDDV